MGRVQIKTTDLGQRFKRMARRHPQAVATAMRRGSSRVLVEVRARTALKRKIDMGDVLRGWNVSVQRNRLRIENRAPHYRFVVRGRRPGGMPPVALLEAWGRRRLGKRGLGWPMARKIALRGIRPTKMLGVTFLSKLRKIMNEELVRAVRQGQR